MVVPSLCRVREAKTVSHQLTAADVAHSAATATRPELADKLAALANDMNRAELLPSLRCARCSAVRVCIAAPGVIACALCGLPQ